MTRCYYSHLNSLELLFLGVNDDRHAPKDPEKFASGSETELLARTVTVVCVPENVLAIMSKLQKLNTRQSANDTQNLAHLSLVDELSDPESPHHMLLIKRCL